MAELNQDFSGFFSNSPGAAPKPAAAQPAATPDEPPILATPGQAAPAAPDAPVAKAPAPAPATSALSTDFSSMFAPAQQPQAARAPMDLDTTLNTEGATKLKPLVSAFMGQETNGGKNTATSIDGAQGPMQIMKDTFAQYAKPGEQIGNANDNIAVGTRMLSHYDQMYDGNAAKIAVAYFSGPGNVSTSGSNPWKVDKTDGNGVHVSTYVQGILGRMKNAPAGAASNTDTDVDSAPDATATPAAPPPTWSSIVANPAFKALDAKTQQQTSDAYFNKYILPNTPADQIDTVKAEWATKSQAATSAANPSLLKQAGSGITSAANALTRSGFETDGDTPDNPSALAAAIRQPAPGPLGVLGNGSNLPPVAGATPAATAALTAQPFVTPQAKQQQFNAYDAATPDQRVAMTQQPGVVGQLAQMRAAQYAGNANPASGDIATSVEGRNARLLAGGDAPDVAAAQAQQQAASGAPTVAPMGLSPTNFDFDSAAKWAMPAPRVIDPDRSVPGAMLDRFVDVTKDGAMTTARGVYKGYEGSARYMVGATQFLADAAGATETSGFLGTMAAGLQGKIATVGEPSDYMQRMYENSVSAVTQIIPAMLGGAAVGGFEALPLAQMYMQGFGSSYADGRAAGQDPAQAMLRSSLMGTFAIIGHAAGIDAYMKAIQQTAEHAATGDIAQSLFQGAVRDMPSMQAMAFGNFVTDKLPGGIGLSPEAKFTDYLHQAADMAVQSLMMSGMLGTSAVAGGMAGAMARMQRGEIGPSFDQGSNTASDKFGNYWRVEPSFQENVPKLPGAPGTSANAPHASQVAADAAVRDMAAAHGLDASGIIPDATPVPQAVPTPPEAPKADDTKPADGLATDQEILEIAQQRFQTLYDKQKGSIDSTTPAYGQDDTNTPGQALTPAERMEFDALKKFAGDPAALGRFYGLGLEDMAPGHADALNAAAHEAATSPKNDLTPPTKAQQDAGNYQMGHLPPTKIQGLDISIENPQGSTRSGVDPDGVVWSNTMSDHYGYIKGTVGGDNERIDAYVGQNPASKKVFIVDQNNADGSFDEHKVMIGFDSLAQADAAYHSNYAHGWNGRGAISELPMGMFKEWLASGDTKQPYARRTTPSTRSIVVKPDVPDTTVESAFTTAKGSTYSVHPDGTTTRAKSFHPEHGPDGDAGLKARSEKTFYVDDAGLDALGHFQTTGHEPMARTVEALKDGRYGVKYNKGKDAGKFEKASATAVHDKPAVGLHPVELWDGGKIVHFGNRITEVSAPKTGTPSTRSIENLKSEIPTRSPEAAPDKAPTKKSQTARFSGDSEASPEVAPVKAKKKTEKQLKQERELAEDHAARDLEPKRFGTPVTDPITVKTTKGDVRVKMTWAVGPEAYKRIYKQAGGLISYGLSGPVSDTGFMSRAGVIYKGDMTPERAQEIATEIAQQVADEYKPKADKPPKTEKQAKARKQEKENGSNPEAQGSEVVRQDEEGATARAGASDDAGTPGRTDDAAAPRPAPGSAAKPVDDSVAGDVKGIHEIGKNADGETLYEDARGVRSVVDNGVRSTESVAMRPTREGMKLSVEHKGRYLTAEEAQAAQEAEAPPKTEKEAQARKPKPEPEAANDPFANNKTFTRDKFEAAKERMRKKLGTLNAGFDPEMALDGMTMAGAYIESGVRKFADYAREMVKDLGEGIRPHLRSFYEAVRHHPGFDAKGMTTSAELDLMEKEGTAAHVAGLPHSLVDHFYSEMTAGRLPKDNNALRKMVATFDGKPVDNARLKMAQEDLEAAIAHRSRDLVAQGKDDHSTFETLVGLYNDQPLLNMRTSTSIENQAYSTPAPLAYVAARLAGIGPETKVYEPTAGNGMLLLTADPKNATVNELETQRFGNLKAQGFEASQGDALKAIDAGVVKAKSQDAVITNPPFGSVKNSDGKPIKVAVDGFKIGQIDHLIAADALRTMKDDGKATLILGAGMQPGAVKTDDRIFFNWLYGNYNVTSHFEVDGKLYSRQGASWPVRVITVDGRQKSDAVSPREGTIARVDTWGQVYEQYRNGLDAQDADVGDGQRGAVSASGTDSGDDAGSVGVVPGKQSSEVGGRGPAGSEKPVGDVVGARPGTVLDRPAEQPTRLSELDSANGRDGALAQPDRLETGSETRPDAPAPGGTELGAVSRGDRVVSNDADNQFQTKYIPRSSRKDEGVLIPVNMAAPTQAGLNKLEDEVGSIDAFAARELGYDSIPQLHDALMGLQIDSVASAIHQMANGKGTIIADQTGIGKGRQAAAIIRWAARNGHIPIFVSVKPQLFTDMYGDLADIGSHDINPVLMNIDAWITGPGGNKLFANKPSKHRKVIADMAASGQLPEGANALFMTYSQINKPNAQRAAVMALADRAVFVLDESHNAGGASGTGDFVKEALEPAKGVVYLSATYAKRPDNMPVYFKTDIGDAIADDESLLEAMAAGGLPLQTVVSNNLVKAGQMFRRERSFDGVSIDTKTDTTRRAVHEKLSDEATEALRAIVEADTSFHEGHVQGMKDDAAAQGGNILDNAGNKATGGVEHTQFTSIVHNFVRQMLLGLKADTAADEAIKALKNGEKPIIAVENTMGSFLNEYAEAKGLAHGASLGNFDYRNVLSRALDRTRGVTVVAPNGDKNKVYVPLSELTGHTLEQYQAAQAMIDSLRLDIPVSPIDWMRHRLEKAGYSVAEITGRNRTVDYNEKVPTLSALSHAEQNDKVATTRMFNDGTINALILNVAGSTGISLHASEKFSNQQVRHMIVAQPAQDINIFMQMLGRIHRTGQVVLPKYTILSVDLPAENRPTALLSKKMKSLNANTSSNTESATSIKTPDMLNQYGDQVIGAYLEDNPALRKALGVSALSDKGDPEIDLARKATGRLALMPVATQHAFYSEVSAQYESMIDYLNKTNQNDLEPRTFDYDAKETRLEVLHQGENPNSPFGEDALYGEYSIKAQGKPMTPDEIREDIKTNLAGQTGKEHAIALMYKLTHQLEESADLARIAQGLGDTFDEPKYRKALKAQKTKAEDIEAKVYRQLDAYKRGGRPATDEDANTIEYNTVRSSTTFLEEHTIGSMWRVEINGEMYNAVVTNLKSTHKATGNPFAMSKLQVSLALNGSLRHVTVPATQFKRIEISDMRGSLDGMFRVRPGNERETAKVVTGNLLAAYGEMNTNGRIINFTKSDGTTEQGILLPKKFDPVTNVRQEYRLRTAADALTFLNGSNNPDLARFGIASRDGNIRVLASGRGVTLQVPVSKAKGAKYFLDKNLTAITGDFVTYGKSMMVNVPSDKAEAALDVVLNKSALYTLPSMTDEAREILNDPKTTIELPKPDDAEPDEPTAHFDIKDVSTFANESALSAKSEPDRTSALVTLRRLSAKAEEGKLTDAEFRLATQNLLHKLETKRDTNENNRFKPDRERGDLYVRERLLRAVRQGDITLKTADFAQWLLDQNPAIADDLGIAVRSSNDPKNTVAGSYNPANRVVTLMKGAGNDTTAVHEILHHTERMMPDDVQHGVYKEWANSFIKALKDSTPAQRPLFTDMLAASLGDKPAWDRVLKGFKDGVLNYKEHYKLVNPSEFWAVNATDILKARHDAPGWVGHARQWLSEMVEQAKGTLGLRSDAPVLRGLKEVLNGEGTHVTRGMMSENMMTHSRREAVNENAQADAAEKAIYGLDHLYDLVNNPRDALESASDKLTQALRNNKESVNTFGLWDKTIGTQLNKALKDADFGRVFNVARSLHNTVSTVAVRPSNLAKDVLPHSNDFRQNWKKLVAGSHVTEQMKKATQALLDGTLAGDTVMQGKVWSEKDLAANYGMDANGIKLYNQTRAAVDASLDEVAASEAWGLAQGFVPKEMRELIIDNPNASQRMIRESLDSKIAVLERAQKAALNKGDTRRAEGLQAVITPYQETRDKVEEVFERAEFLKSAGYLPLMRFGRYSVTGRRIDPETGEPEVDGESGEPPIAYFGLFPTEAEARVEADRQIMLYQDDPTIQITRGRKSERAHELFDGMSPETIALFADAVGAQEAMKSVIQLATSERSALRRRLQRQGIAGFSQDLPRILSSFLTSNARFAAQRYYMRDLNSAIESIPKEKGDVRDQAVDLKKYMMGGSSAGNNVTAVMFGWYLAGSVVSAATIVTELPLKTVPYLMSFGMRKGLAALVKATPYALGRKQVTDPAYRAAIARASREGIVAPQEVFHLYELGAQNIATWLASKLASLPLIKDPASRTAEELRVRFGAFMTIAGMLHSMAESFNRRMAFHSAWHLGKSLKVPDPYQFAANTTDETSGIYAKYNRPNWARGVAGRTLLAFKHWEITYFEIMRRMIRRGGLPMLKYLGLAIAAQTAAAGIQGLPFMGNIDDLIDTAGNLTNHNWNAAAYKRQMLDNLLGHHMGDALMHGLSRLTPWDMSSHLDMGHVIPGTNLLKLATTHDRSRSVADILGPSAGILGQLSDAYDAATGGNWARAALAIAPVAPKHIMQAVGMLDSGHAVSAKGKNMGDVTTGQAVSKLFGFQSPEQTRPAEARQEIAQSVGATIAKQGQIKDMWALGLAQHDPDMVKKAMDMRNDWNAKNPDTPVTITTSGLRSAVKSDILSPNTRAIINSPRAMKGATAAALKAANEP